MKQEQFWQSEQNTPPRRGIFARIVGGILVMVSIFIFLVAGSISSTNAQGILEILGIGLISLAFTLLITGFTVERTTGGGEDDRFSK